MGIISDAQKTPSDTVTILGLNQKPVTLSSDDLSKMDHASLSLLRDYNPDNKAAQSMIAPYEHQAFAKEATTDNLGLALPIALATPLYAAAKSVGLMTDSSTTPPSWDQVKQGLLGVGQGIVANLKNRK